MSFDPTLYLQVREISCHPDPYGRLAASIGKIQIFNRQQYRCILFVSSKWVELNLYACIIAPEIFGHEDVKKALLLQLVGGVNR